MDGEEKGKEGTRVYRNVSMTTLLLIKPHVSFLGFMYHAFSICLMCVLFSLLTCLFDLFNAPVIHRVWEHT